MAEPPYRAMPLPVSPARAWRPIVERGLAAFNGLVVLFVLVATLLEWRFNGPRGIGGIAPFLLVPTFIAVAACVGFAGRGRRAARTILILPSAFVWTLFGACALIAGVFAFRTSWPHAPPNLPFLALVAIPFLSAGVLTVETQLAWRRGVASKGE